jgi:hypothetical protein
VDSELVGLIGQLTVSVPEDGGPGEVVLPVRGGTEAFTAYADEPIPKYTVVVVVDKRSARSVTVTPMP